MVHVVVVVHVVDIYIVIVVVHVVTVVDNYNMVDQDHVVHVVDNYNLKLVVHNVVTVIVVDYHNLAIDIYEVDI